MKFGDAGQYELSEDAFNHILWGDTAVRVADKSTGRFGLRCDDRPLRNGLATFLDWNGEVHRAVMALDLDPHGWSIDIVDLEMRAGSRLPLDLGSNRRIHRKRHPVALHDGGRARGKQVRDRTQEVADLFAERPAVLERRR